MVNMTRTYWLSFCDNDRPAGQQFLGVAVVDVTEKDRAEAEVITREKWGERDEEVYWLGAAIRKSHQEGCNPGGEVASARIDEFITPETPDCPRHRLLSKAELQALGHM